MIAHGVTAPAIAGGLYNISIITELNNIMRANCILLLTEYASPSGARGGERLRAPARRDDPHAH